MTVPEMRKLLGLKKTDRYWLVHKNVFESKEIAGKIRINIASFEKWYANQIKYHKVTGEEPGKELKCWSYSVKEVADLLGVDDYLVYELLKKNQMEAVIVDYWKRIPKESFQNWYCLLYTSWMRKPCNVFYSLLTVGLTVKIHQICHVLDRMTVLCEPGSKDHILFCFPDPIAV